MVYKWRRDQIETLISRVQKHTCIYNIKSRDYLDRKKKAAAFNNIAEELRKKDSAITLDEVKRKWKNLRIQYTQELRAISKSKKNAASTEDICVPKLWCFHQLYFLKTHSEIRAVKDNIGVFIGDDKAHISSEYENSNVEPKRKNQKNSNVEPKRKKQKEHAHVMETKRERERCPSLLLLQSKVANLLSSQTRAVNEFRNELDNFTDVISQRKKENPYGWLGALVVHEMERISPQDQPDAAWKVQCLMRILTAKSFRKRKNSSTASSVKDILEQSMEDIFVDN